VCDVTMSIVDEQKSKSQLIQELQELRTQQKHGEVALRERNKELALLNRVSQALFSSLDIGEILPILLEEVRSWLGAAFVSVWLVDIETRELVCREVAGPQDHMIRGWRLPAGQGIAGYVIQTGESVMVSDAQQDSRHNRLLDYRTGLMSRAMLIIPLRSQKEIFGVLQVVDTESERFRSSDLTAIESIAATAAMVLQNIRLYEQALREAEVKGRLLKEMNHRVRSNLSAIMGLLYAERRRNIDNRSAFTCVMDELIGRVQSIATVHNMLSVSGWRSLMLSELVSQIVSSVLQGGSRGVLIPVQVDAASIKVTPDQARSLALIVNELVVDMLKQPALIGQGLRVTMGVKPGSDVIQLKFMCAGQREAGEAFQNEKDNKSLKLVDEIVRENLGGEVQVYDEADFVIVINFKSETSGELHEGT